MIVHLCGVRGSFPATGQQYAHVGGNTSCVAVAADGQPPSLLLDAGTGVVNVTPLLGGEPFVGTVVLGHLHWDHVLGLPFFPAADRPGSRVQVLVPEQGMPAEELITRLMSPPLFPIGPNGLRGEWCFDTYGEGTFDAGPFTVTARQIPHPGGRTMGLRVGDGSSSLAYLSDHSPHDIGPGADGLGELHPAAVALADGVDLLIHDAQYTADELPTKATWGHAAAPYGATLAAHCRVPRLLLYHHDPRRSDEQVAALRDAVAAAHQGEPPLTIDVAREGMSISL